MSLLFLCALAAVVITLVGYFGIWEWPAWPAFALLHLVFGYGDPWLALSDTARVVWMVILITVNIAVWTAIVYAMVFGVRQLAAAFRRRSLLRRV